MIARRLLGLAMLAYPPDLREARGDEIVDTVLNVSHGSPWRVTRESVALIRSGLGARANVTASSGARRLAATVCAQAATSETPRPKARALVGRGSAVGSVAIAGTHELRLRARAGRLRARPGRHGVPRAPTGRPSPATRRTEPSPRNRRRDDRLWVADLDRPNGLRLRRTSNRTSGRDHGGPDPPRSWRSAHVRLGATPRRTQLTRPTSESELVP